MPRFTFLMPGADSGWIGYMLKKRQKDGLEQWSDCILGTFYNPTVDF